MGSERSKDLTSFRGASGGLFRYRFMPNGFVNAMAIWTRFLDMVLEPYHFECVLCYADDCLVYTKSESLDDHLKDLDRVFDLFEKYGVKIMVSKLKLCLLEIPFLGVTLKHDGITPKKNKTKAITGLILPTNIGQLRRVLGIFAYYRKFIPKFSEIAAPLYACLGRKFQSKYSKAKVVSLTEEAEQAFEKLKRLITTTPIVLAFPWPFEIH